MLMRERLGLAPGSNDIVFLVQDMNALDSATRSAGADPAELLLLAAEIEGEARRLRTPDLLSKALIQRATILLASNRVGDAITASKAATEALGSLRAEDLKVLILGRLAEAHARLGDWNAVSAVCAEGIRLVETFRERVSGQYLQSSYLRSRIGLYNLGARAAYERGEYETMLHRAELSKAYGTLRQLGGLPSGESQDATRKRFRAVSVRIDEAQRPGLASPEEIDRLRAERRALWDLMLIRGAEARAGHDLPPFRLDAVQACLDKDEAVVYYYWLGPTELIVAALDRRALAVERVVWDDQLRAALDRYAAVAQGLKQGAFSYLNRVGQFTGVLLPERVQPLLRDKRRLILSPHRMLHALPLHALTWEGKPLIRQFAVSYVPNLSALLLPRGPIAPDRRLAVGIKDFAVPGERLEPLDGAEQEVDAIAAVYAGRGMTVDVVKGPEATKARLLGTDRATPLRGYRWIHIATHGENVRGDTPMESSLFLRDARLDGLEVADWRLHADLVVLSACHSGQRSIGGRGLTELPGDEVFGLQSAFFLAGTRQVLGALWPADDDIARQIMTDFHRHLAVGETAEIALQSALVHQLDCADEMTSDLYYWAPFYLATIGSPGRAEAPCRQ
jgi:hypothetical protein